MPIPENRNYKMQRVLIYKNCKKTRNPVTTKANSLTPQGSIFLKKSKNS